MKVVDEGLQKITSFLKKHHVLCLATQSENISWCCNCFYAFLPNEEMFVFTSDENTLHIRQAIANKRVSGSVVLETRIIGKIQGIQFSGEFGKPAGNKIEIYKKAYLKRFPYARFMLAELWFIRVDYFKFTDNSFGFGKKLIWERGGANKPNI